MNDLLRLREDPFSTSTPLYENIITIKTEKLVQATKTVRGTRTVPVPPFAVTKIELGRSTGGGGGEQLVVLLKFSC